MTGNYRNLPEINFFTPRTREPRRPTVIPAKERHPVLRYGAGIQGRGNPQVNNRNPAETQARPGGKEGA